MLETQSPDLAFLLAATFIGIGATAVMDLWSIGLKTAFKVTGLNFALVGRWIGHMRHGQLRHDGIGNSPAIPGESWIGWAAHYAIGILFAAALLGLWGIEWLEYPAISPALTVGLLTVIFPFFILQPCFGLGIAARKLPTPNRARLKSLMSHAAFGLGLYISGLTYHRFSDF